MVGKLTPDDLKNLTKAMESAISKGQAIDDILAKITNSTVNWTSKILEGDKAMKKIAEKLDESSSKGGDLSDRLTSMVTAQKDINKQFATQAFALKNNLKIEEAESELARKELLSLAKANGLTEFRQKLILKRFDKLKESLEIQKKETEYAERIKKIDHERSELMDSINEKYKMAKLIVTDQRALAAAGIATMIKGYHSLNETFDEFRKEGLSVGQAMKETGVGIGAMFSLSGASLKENQELMAGMSESMGNMNSITTDTVAEVGKLAKTLGVSAGEAGKLQGQLQNMPGATAESATNTMEFAGALAMAAHVAPGAVMKDMAANAEDIAVNTKNGGKDMATVSVAAHKLGVEMSSLTKMSAGLLDFESSINKQMEASVLLGREINLDKAREAALNGDILGATQEMLKNVGGEAEFNKMNVIQRKALADSMGVSVSDLSKMVKNQDQLANLTEEQNQALADGVPLSDVLAANAGGFAGKLKDGALFVAGVGATVSEISGGFKDAKEMASGLFGGIKSGLAGMKDGGGIKGGITSMFGGKKPEVPPVDGITGAADKTKGVKGDAGKGIKQFLKGLGDGLASIGKQFGNVVKGAVALGLAGLALGAGFALALQMVKDVDPLVMITFAGSIGIFGAALALMGKMGGSVIKGALALGIVALSLIPAAFAFSLLKGVSVEKIIAFSIALPLLGLAAAGLGFLFPYIVAGAASLALLGVGMIAVAGGLMVLQAAEGGIAVFESLASIAANAAGLGGVALAMVGIAYGLGIMGIAGFAAMPIIGALIALAAVAPALASLGGMFGGDEAGGAAKGGRKAAAEEDKMDTLIGEIKQLRVEVAKGGVVMMDARKVGDALRLYGVTTSNIK